MLTIITTLIALNPIYVEASKFQFTESTYTRDLIVDKLSQKENYFSPPAIVHAIDGHTTRTNVHYRIHSTNFNGLNINETTGLIYLNDPIEIKKNLLGRHDKKSVYEAEITAEDQDDPAVKTTAKLIINIKNDRDGMPYFDKEPYVLSIREDVSRSKPFLKVRARDPDGLDSELRYSIGNDKSELVRIDSLNGELYIDSKADLDFNTLIENPYNFTVFATDNGKPYALTASTVVVLHVKDVNNKAPRFKSPTYSSEIIEDVSKPNDLVLTVEAEDPDSKPSIKYSLVPDMMVIKDKSGISNTLDSVLNSSGGYFGELSREARIKLVVDLKKLFHIDPETGAIYLAHEPDFSIASLFNITVLAMDMAAGQSEIGQNLKKTDQLARIARQTDTTYCTIYVRSSNKKNPVFDKPREGTEYIVNIDEELPIGSNVITLVARNSLTNRPVETFEKVAESDPQGFFEVNLTGTITIAKRIDYESLAPNERNLKLMVKVTSVQDDSCVSYANVTINVSNINDNYPKFSQESYTASVSESLPYPDTILIVSAEDQDSNIGQITYSASGHGQNVFDIDRFNGAVSVKKDAKLDRETDPFYLLQVTATDCVVLKNSSTTIDSVIRHDPKVPHSACKRSSSFITIKVIDENDNKPKWIGTSDRGDYEASVLETSTLGTLVARIKANDSDEGQNGEIGYEIVQSDVSLTKAFKIDSSSGEISVGGPLLGLGRREPYYVLVRAFDHGKQSLSSTTKIIIHVKDVADNDGVPRFVSPLPDETIYISENIKSNSLVYEVAAKDTDSKQTANGQVMYELLQYSPYFTIDPFLGSIRVNYENMQLNREVTPNFTLIAVAHDMGHQPKYTYRVLNIQVEDINNNEPYFERDIDDPPVSFSIKEEVPIGTLIGTIKAVDKDVGANARIAYEIIDGNSNEVFSLRYNNMEFNSSIATDSELANHCQIFTNKRLDREERESYTLVIRAFSVSRSLNPMINVIQNYQRNNDQYTAQQQQNLRSYNSSDLSRIQITVNLIDINDNRPKFEQDNIKKVIDAGTDVYSELIRFVAIDADSPISPMRYYLTDVLFFEDGEQYGVIANSLNSKQPDHVKHLFEIDSATGAVRNLVPLLQFVNGYFELLVQADSGNDVDTTSTRCQINDDSLSTRSIPTNEQVVDNGCSSTTTKATLFITHRRDTFRFVFNKTTLSDKMDEFRERLQNALEENVLNRAVYNTMASSDSSVERQIENPTGSASANRLFINMFNTEFYERDDGSMDFATVSSCSQLIKFNERLMMESNENAPMAQSTSQPASNQIIDYDQALKMMRILNDTVTRKRGVNSLFTQYGVVDIKRCVPTKPKYRISRTEMSALAVAAGIAILGILLACIVSKKRKRLEKKIEIIQRSKLQMMNPYEASAHHHSLMNMHLSNQFAPAYAAYEYE